MKKGNTLLTTSESNAKVTQLACCICPSETEIDACECGEFFCPIHMRFHRNYTCKLRKKKKGSVDDSNDN